MPKSADVKGYIVLTADQIASRRTGDRVPAALDALRARLRRRVVRGFARTAGDEIQGLLMDADAVVVAVETLSRLGGWRIGIGVGAVEHPIPRDVRAATGPAFLAARDALIAARGAPQDLRVSSAVDTAGGTTAVDVEAVLALLVVAWRRRTEAGWQAVDLVASGRSQQDIAHSLGVTPSAVSQRLRAALREETEAGMALAGRLLETLRRDADGPVPVGARS